MKSNLKQLILILICMNIFTLSAMAQLPTGHFKIYNTSNHQEISWSDFVTETAKNKIILWGEEHNDSIGHLLEFALWKALTENNKKWVLSLEMFEVDVQPIMNEYLNGWISEKNFKKEARSWSNYKDYEYLVNDAKENGLYVNCSNAPARYVNMVTRGGLESLNQLPKKTLKTYLPFLPIDTLKGAYHQKFLEIMGGHSTPNLSLYASQNLWDASMAYHILKQAKKRSVFHINGRFHTDHYLGTAERVKKGTQQKTIVISCFDAPEYQAEEDGSLADFVIITSKTPFE